METVDRIGDPARLALLQRSGMLRYPQRERLERVCYTVTQLLSAEIAEVNAVTATGGAVQVATWPPGSLARLPASIVGCGLVVERNETVVISDTSLHPATYRWADVHGGYLGTPLRLDGQAVGSLCALSRHPREWTAQDVMGLEALAMLAVAALD